MVSIMPPQLLALSEGPSILLDKPILLIGRHQECDVQLASRKVSRRHCCVAQVGDQLVVRDLGSTNGIRINGIRVVEGALHTGDELTIGNQRYKLQWNAPAGEPPPQNAQPAPAARPGKREEDARLESAEEPVPLASASGSVAPLRAAPAAPPPVVVPADGKAAKLAGDKPEKNGK